MKTNRKWIPIFLLPTILIFLLIYAWPLIQVFITSLYENKLSSPDVKFVGLDNFFRLFHDPAFFTAFKNTLIWILIHCILHVGLGLLLALVLYKKPRGWQFVRTAYMIPNIISNAAMGMIFLNIFNPKFGVVNSFLRLVGLDHLTHNWLMDSQTAFGSVTLIWALFAGYTTTLILAQALTVDQSIIDAAKVDGASAGQIMLPLLKKMIGTTVVMAATYMLQLFDLIYITTNGGPGKTTTNLPLLLYGIYKNEGDYGYVNAIGVVIILLGAICMVTINKIFEVNKDD